MTRVDAILERYPPDCRPMRVESLRSAGGMSGAQFWRIATPCGLLVLRRWPLEHPSPERLHFIHSVLRHAASRGIAFIPLPIAARDGQSFVAQDGHLWELAPWLSGAADYASSPSTEKLRAAMTSLARFHVAVADYPDEAPTAGPSAVARHLERLRELARTRAGKLSSALTDARWPELTSAARRFVAALPGAVPRAIAALEPLADAPLPRQPCLRDIWHDHVLYTGEQVTGLLDFGAVDMDTPATDIARLLGSLVGDDAPRWQSGLAAYCSIRPLTVHETLAARELDASGTILAGSNWIRWLFLENRQFENRAQVLKRFRRIAARLESQ